MKEKQYLKIYNKIRSEIVTGAYSFNTKLPSKRVTAMKYNVSIITVEHAYDLLIEEGYIYPKERSGYYVVYNEKDSFSPPERVKATTVQNTFSNDVTFPFSIYAKTVRKVLNDYDDNIFQKSENFGHPLLREAICRYLNRSRDITVKSSQIIIGSGAEYLYSLIIQLLGRNIIYGIESPSYEQIARLYNAGGVSYELLPLGPDGIVSDVLWSCDADVIHITPYRSYPTGISATAAKKREYIKWAVQKNAYIIEDDVESEFSKLHKPEETLFSLNDEKVIYVNSFSLTISPSVRVGYMVVPASLEENLSKISFFSCTVPTLEQLVLSEIINSGDFERHLNRKRREIRKKQ